MYNGKTIVLIAGPKHAGKDTVAEILSQISGLAYSHSTSATAAKAVYDAGEAGELTEYGITPGKYKDPSAAYTDRDGHRDAWVKVIKALNSPNGYEMYIRCIEEGNQILTGLRSLQEVQACYGAGLIDLAIWVCTSIKEPGDDHTLKYGPEMCDFIIENERREDPKRTQLRRKLTKIWKTINHVGYPG